MITVRLKRFAARLARRGKLRKVVVVLVRPGGERGERIVRLRRR